MKLVKKLDFKKLPKKDERLFANVSSPNGCWWVYTIRKIEGEVCLCTIVGTKIRQIEEGFKYILAKDLEGLLQEED